MTPDGMPRILLVEDDARLADVVAEYLRSHGMEVAIEARGDRAVTRIVDECPDLVILDIMLPGLDGFTVCRRVRPEFAGPILMMTARGDEVDEIVGLEIGADDYLAKPVQPRRLLTRILTLLRRATRADGPWPPPRDDHPRIVLGDLVVDPRCRSAHLAGREVDLTTAEFDLLHLLASHAGDVVSRDRIYTVLRGIDYDGLDRSADLRVARLRKKLGDDARQPALIKSVRGAGYLMAKRT
ncbi:MAG: response regulator [Deltaproteobacteria bacterium]|nr:response regulator [Deltaproteobacteria bacterium]